MDIEAAIAGVAEQTPGIVSVYLFGSFAENANIARVMWTSGCCPTGACTLLQQSGSMPACASARIYRMSRTAMPTVEMTFMVERLVELRRHLEHLWQLRPKVTNAGRRFESYTEAVRNLRLDSSRSFPGCATSSCTTICPSTCTA